MSYTNPVRTSHSRTVDGATTATWAVSPPPGATQFRVSNISASVTTSFVGTTSAAIFGVGVAGNVNAAGKIVFGTTSSPSQAGTTVGYKDQYIKGTNPTYGSMDLTGTSNTITGTPTVPEVLGPVLLTMTAAAGTPAGAAIVDVTIDWF